MKCIVCENICYNFLNLTNLKLYNCNHCFHIQSNKNCFSKKTNLNKKNINQLINPNEIFNNCQKTIYIKCIMMGDYFIINDIFPYYYQKSYFTTNSLYYLCNKHNYKIVNISMRNEHTYVFELSKSASDHNKILFDMLYKNLCNELYCQETFNNYNLKFQIYKNKIHNILLKHKLYNFNIIGYGGSFLSNVLLNEFNDKSLIRRFTKTNPPQVDKNLLFVILDYKNYNKITNKIKNFTNLPKYTFSLNIYPIKIEILKSR